MGAGKSSIGKRLAKALHLPFVDSDTEITRAAACSIPDIFELYGEAIFRDLEKRVLTRLITEEEPAIIATGGGAFINPDLRELILSESTAVWLKADLDVLYERVARKHHRPLLETGDKREILQKLMDERYPIYEKAHITVDSDNGVHDNVVNKVMEALRERETL